MTGSISGTHANPAITLALALYRKFSWVKVFFYCCAQILGGFLGAGLVYSLYYSVIDHYNIIHHTSRQLGNSASIFITAPGLAITPFHAFTNEIILTSFLVFSVFAITEHYNNYAPQANMSALIIGLVVAIIGASSGYLEGWAINPARDLGPRLFIYTTGWGQQAFPGISNYWWVPILGPTLGGIIGGGLYQILIKPYLPSTKTLPPTL